MSVAGLCEICDRPSVEYTCDRCARLVCERHFDRQTGLCVNCSGEVGGSPGKGEEPAKPDGVDTYRF